MDKPEIQRQLHEFKMSNWAHNAIDIASGLSDFFSAGTAGPVIDILHALIYFKEASDESGEAEKSILAMQGAITLGTALMPAVAQAVGPIAKNAIRAFKTGKSVKVNKTLWSKIMDIFSIAKPYINGIQKMMRNPELEELGSHIASKKPKASDKAQKGYAYMSVLSKKAGIHAGWVLNMPESLAETAYEVVQSVDLVDFDSLERGIKDNPSIEVE